MKFTHVTLIPQKQVLKEAKGKLTDHLYITIDTDKTATVIIVPEGDDSGLAPILYIDMTDLADELVTKENSDVLFNMLMKVVTSITDEELKSKLSDAQVDIVKKAFETLTNDLPSLKKEYGTKPQGNIITFLLSSGKVYNLDIDTLDWERMAANIPKYVNTLFYLRTFVTDLHLGTLTEERKKEAAELIVEAFKAINIDPDYSNCIPEDATEKERYFPVLYDLSMIYSQMLTNVIQKRDEMVFGQRIEELIRNLQGPTMTPPAEDETSEPTEDVDVIDAAADAVEEVDAEIVEEGN